MQNYVKAIFGPIKYNNNVQHSEYDNIWFYYTNNNTDNNIIAALFEYKDSFKDKYELSSPYSCSIYDLEIFRKEFFTFNDANEFILSQLINSGYKRLPDHYLALMGK